VSYNPIRSPRAPKKRNGQREAATDFWDFVPPIHGYRIDEHLFADKSVVPASACAMATLRQGYLPPSTRLAHQRPSQLH